MEFAELVMRRRTVRRFEDSPVEREVLEKIARLGQHVPSAGFSQGQRLVIVTDPEQRRRVAETCGEPFYADLDMGNWISECAAQFIPCVSAEIYHRRLPGARQDGRGRPGDGLADALLVDRHRQDVDGRDARRPRRGSRRRLRRAEDSRALRGVLGLPDEFHPIGVIPVGPPLPDVRSPSLKRGWVPFEDFAHWDRW